MRVTIITPTYNRADLLPETIDSVLAQDYPDIEYIVLDDGSTDDTTAVLARYAGRIRTERHDNMGETATVNKGFDLATGDIICVVSSDDPLLPGAVRYAVEVLARNPDALGAYPDWVVIGPRSEYLRVVRLPDYDIRSMLQSRSWGLGPGAFFRRKALEIAGKRNPQLVFCGDMEFWLRVAARGRLVHMQRRLATHRVHPGSASVSGRNVRFAKEWVGVWHAMLSDPHMPADILVQKAAILQLAYSVDAAHYCGEDRLEAWLMRLRGIYFGLPAWATRVRVDIRAVRRFPPIAWARFLLKKVLPASLVHRLRNAVFGTHNFLLFVRRSGWSPIAWARYLFREVLPASWAQRVRNTVLALHKFLLFVFSARRLPARWPRLAFWSMIWLARRRLGITAARRGRLADATARFAVCTRFTPPLWSGQAVVIGRLLDGLPPENYCLVSAPLYAGKDAGNFTDSLPGKRFSLPDERELRPVRWFPERSWKLNMLYRIWQRGFNIAAALRAERVDTIVGCSGDLLDPPAAYLASRILDCKFLLYFFDDYTEQWWADRPLRAFVERIERFIMPRCSFAFVPNEFLDRELFRRHGHMSVVVRNPRAPGPLAVPVTRFPAQPGEIRLVFTGAVYHLNYDILRAVLAAIALRPGLRMKLHIYTAQPREQIEAEGLSGPCIEIHPHLHPAEVAEVQRHADVLLIPFSFQAEAQGIVRTASTAKLADYLATGRPILALCPDDSFLGWFIAEHGCGMVVPSDDPERIASALDAIARDEELRLRMRRSALALAEGEFSPQRAQRVLCDALRVLRLPDHLRRPAPPRREEQLRITHVSGLDLLGIQVNGYLLHKYLQDKGHDSRMLVYGKASSDDSVQELGGPLARRLNDIAVNLETRLSSVSLLPILSRNLAEHPLVRDADIVHLQLVHNMPFFSLLDLPKLSARKRVLLSVHDQYFMTGHCVYSLSCERWRTGCGKCPDLAIPFAIRRDATARNFKIKRWAFDRSQIDIVIGSRWQEERVSASPILSKFPRHMIPYAADTRVFRPGDRQAARAALGIPENAHVIAFRSTPFSRNFKGTEYIVSALAEFVPRRPTFLLTFEGLAGLQPLREKYGFIELGWVFDQEKIAQGLQAADVFLMPSLAEAFGLMAVESMACGTPVIVFEGTALPETIGAPDSGIAVPYKDAAALRRAIERCLDDPAYLDRLRQNGLRHVAAKHSFETYANSYVALYERLAAAPAPAMRQASSIGRDHV